MYLKLIGFAYTKVSSSFRRQHFPLWKEKRTWLEGNKSKFAFIHRTVTTNCRGIEWSLRAFANMRAVCLFLRARAVVKFFSRAVSTLELQMASSEHFRKNTDGEQRALRALRKFSASRNLSFINRIRCFAPINSL